MPIKIPKTRRKKKTVYDPFLNKKITVENEPYEALTSSVDQKIENHHKHESNSLLRAFGSDIVWFSVSISVLLASILFYFQVLQPRILNQISLQAQAQTLQVNNTFNSQINEIAKTQSSILNKNLNAFTDICNPTQIYSDMENDEFQLEQLSKKLQPDSENQSLQPYNIFSSSEISSTFDQYFNTYQNELNELQIERTKLEEFLSYKNYKNNWINNCIELQKSLDTSSTIEEICLDENQLPSQFDQLNEIYSQLESIEADQTKLCQDWNNTILFIPNEDGLFVNNNTFVFEWTDLYSRITQLDQEVITSFDTERLNQKISSFENLANQTVEEIISIAESKKGLTNIWYLLDINTDEVIN